MKLFRLWKVAYHKKILGIDIVRLKSTAIEFGDDMLYATGYSISAKRVGLIQWLRGEW